MASEGNPGWAFWPEREDMWAEFTRLLGAAQEGGSTVAECWATAARIDFSSDRSWHAQWTRTADINSERGDAALRDGNVVTARSNWLRALNYYQAAGFPFDRSEEAYQAALANMRRCAGNYLRYGSPSGDIVSIPWSGGYELEGYFVPAGDAASGGAPLVICVGEPGQRKEEYLYKYCRYARDRGMSLLAVDLLGAGTGDAFETMVGRTDLEGAIGQVMDYLIERDDVDPQRIAIIADACGSSFVARGIAFDDRFAAAVCDGGIWDLHERSFLRNRAVTSGAGMSIGPVASSVARRIKCPVLIPVGERGWLKAEQVRHLYERLQSEGRDVTLKIFTSEETASAQGHADNPTLANEYIFDWIAARLAAAGAQARGAGGSGRNDSPRGAGFRKRRRW